MDQEAGGHKMTNQWRKGEKDRPFTVTMDQVPCLVGDKVPSDNGL